MQIPSRNHFGSRSRMAVPWRTQPASAGFVLLARRFSVGLVAACAGMTSRAVSPSLGTPRAFMPVGCSAQDTGANGMTQRALFISNRRASHVQAALADAASCLEGRGFTLVRPKGDGAPGIAGVRQQLADVDLVIIAGGDGTVNAVIGALVGQPKALGIIPLGTANDLARTLEIPLDIPAACDVIAAGRVRQIDVTSVNGRYFCNVASIGLSVDITRRLTRQTKRRWGIYAYLLASARGLRELRHFHAVIRSPEGEIRTRSVQIAVGNGKFYGGGMVVAADATIFDHQLHIYSLEVEHWWEMLALFPALRRGSQIYWRRARTLVAGDVQISTRRPRTIDIDGELVLKTPAHFRVLPAAVSVLCSPA
jgi:diacylglycerol kinase (ATP)